MRIGRTTAVMLGTLLAAAAAPAVAEQTLYIIDGNGSGSIDGTSFSNASYQIRLVADSDVDIASFGLAPTSATVRIGSLGTYGFTNQVYFGEVNGGIYLAGRNTRPFVTDFLDFGLPNGDFVDIYGPFAAVVGSNPKLDQFVGIPTSGGAATLTSSSSVTFAAFAVPEPASWAMMLGGFACAGAALRRRRVTFA